MGVSRLELDLGTNASRPMYDEMNTAELKKMMARPSSRSVNPKKTSTRLPMTRRDSACWLHRRLSERWPCSAA